MQAPWSLIAQGLSPISFGDRVTHSGRSITVSSLQSLGQYWLLDVRLSKTLEGAQVSDRESVELQIAKCEKYAEEERR
jgi:hypothetical protein